MKTQTVDSQQGIYLVQFDLAFRIICTREQLKQLPFPSDLIVSPE